MDINEHQDHGDEDDEEIREIQTEIYDEEHLEDTAQGIVRTQNVIFNRVGQSCSSVPQDASSSQEGWPLS